MEAARPRVSAGTIPLGLATLDRIKAHPVQAEPLGPSEEPDGQSRANRSCGTDRKGSRRPPHARPQPGEERIASCSGPAHDGLRCQPCHGVRETPKKEVPHPGEHRGRVPLHDSKERVILSKHLPGHGTVKEVLRHRRRQQKRVCTRGSDSPRVPAETPTDARGTLGPCRGARGTVMEVVPKRHVMARPAATHQAA